jgi:hypothetical protein
MIINHYRPSLEILESLIRWRFAEADIAADLLRATKLG